MTHSGFSSHLDAERLQAFLEDELPKGERARIEEHLAGCARCSAELADWRGIFDDLGGLRPHRPLEGFADRVMAKVRVPKPLPFAARVLNRVLGPFRGSPEGHVASARLQDFVEGLLPARGAASVAAHLQVCATCSTGAEEWASVLRRLDALPRFAPGDAFATRVMAQVRVPVAPRVVTAEGAARRALAWARRLAPRTRRAWAALSGVAVAPAVTIGLVLYTVFSHPTVTPGALAAFLWWQIGDLAQAGWTALSGALVENADVFGLYSFVQSLTSAPLMLAAGIAAYSLASALALRVLYRNLIATRSVVTGHAQVSAS